MHLKRRFCTFYLDNLWFGVQVERVQEVVPLPAITPVPLALETIAGLANLRGKILTVIELRRRLGLEDPRKDGPRTMIVAHGQNTLLGLLVDEIGEVAVAPESEIETARLPADYRELVSTVYPFPEGLLHLLDLDKVIGIGESLSTGPNGGGQHRRAIGGDR